MKKILLTLTLISTAFAIEWADNFDAAKALAKKEHKPIMVMFTTKYCATCEYMKERVYTVDTVANYIDANFISVEVDIDEHPDKYGFRVFGTPTYYFLSPEGKTINRPFIGGANAETFIKKLKEYKGQ